MKLQKFGFYVNGERLIKTVICSDIEAAKKKLDFLYPVNFNIQIKKISDFELE